MKYWVWERHLTQAEPITLSPGTEKECKSASVGQGHVIWMLEWRRRLLCYIGPNATEMEGANLQRKRRVRHRGGERERDNRASFSMWTQKKNN